MIHRWVPAAGLAAMLWTLGSGPGLCGSGSGDPGRGRDVFQEQCSDCHSVLTGKNRKGPSLFGVVGRSSASISGYAYSDAMRHCGFVWTPDRLDAYIAGPRRLVPGCKMKFDGLDDARSRADLIAFLSQQR
jgi:cytochrome c